MNQQSPRLVMSRSIKLNHALHGGQQYESTDIFLSVSSFDFESPIEQIHNKLSNELDVLIAKERNKAINNIAGNGSHISSNPTGLPRKKGFGRLN